jgi:hypothetical protein
MVSANATATPAPVGFPAGQRPARLVAPGANDRHPRIWGFFVLSRERDGATIGFRRLAAWVRRSLDAIVADVKPVDCGSLDVLLYCTDDVAVSAPREWALTGPAELA